MHGDRRVRVLVPGESAVRRDYPGKRASSKVQPRGDRWVPGWVFSSSVRYAYTGIAAPDTRCASGEARNRYARAMSATFGHEPWPASGMAARLAGVSMMLGTTQLTVMPVPLVSS